MQIFIPSADRADVCAKYTGKMLEGSALSVDTYLVVPRTQAKEYRRALPKLGILVIPDEYEYNGIGVKRQYILENLSGRHSFQVDDDLKFYTRIEGNKTRRSVPEEIHSMFSLLEKWLEEPDIALVSAGQRFMFQQYGEYHENNACIHVLGIDKDIFIRENIRFDAIPLTSDDIYVSMDVLVKGYSSRITDMYLQEGMPMNYKGGISRYRDAEAINKSVRALQESFPDYIKYRKDVEIKNIGRVLGTVINWKKAYQAGQVNKGIKKLWKE